MIRAFLSLLVNKKWFCRLRNMVVFSGIVKKKIPVLSSNYMEGNVNVAAIIQVLILL
jgi:hypothetical protein